MIDRSNTLGSRLLLALVAAALLVSLGLTSSGCGSDSASVVGDSAPLPPDSAPLPPDSGPEPDLWQPVDMGPPVEPRYDGTIDAPPPPPPPPALVTARGLIHMHSIYSHDACDGKGFVDGKPNTQCLAELRAAACANKLDFLAMTDHPANFRDYTPAETLLHDSAAGDQLIGHQGKVIANRIACPGGHKVLLTAGFEANHMMPLGLHGKPAASDKAAYAGVTDATDPAVLKAQVQQLKAHGAVVSMVHSEEDNISAKTIDDAGYDAMEWYNIHASFKALLGNGDLLSADLDNIVQLAGLVGALQDMADFIAPGSGAHPDLVYMLLLEQLPPGGFDKWRAIQRGRPITGLLGSDIHRNVSVDVSMCAGIVNQLACGAALAVVESTLGVTVSPVIKNLLLAGGEIAMSDGDRVDSYARLMRWLENRVIVSSVEPIALAEALRAGRSYGVFTVFGNPDGFSYRANEGIEMREIGDSAKGSLTLQLRLPPRPLPTGVPFTPTEAMTAEVRATVVHTDASGSKVIHEVKGLNNYFTTVVSQPGAYHVELFIKPKHLAKALGPKGPLADKEYLWVITNPIRITQ